MKHLERYNRSKLSCLGKICFLSAIILLSGCGNATDADLVRSARSTSNMLEFQEICGKIGDQPLLGDLAISSDTWGKRRTALDFITNIDVLARVASKVTDYDIVNFANRRLEAIKSGESLDNVPTIHWGENNLSHIN